MEFGMFTTFSYLHLRDEVARGRSSEMGILTRKTVR